MENLLVYLIIYINVAVRIIYSVLNITKTSFHAHLISNKLTA